MAHSGVRYVHMYLCYHWSECCTLCYNSPSPPLQKNQDMESGQPKKEIGIEKMSTEAPGSGQNYLGLLLKWKQMCPQSPAKSVRRRLLETHSHKAKTFWALINKLGTHVCPCMRKGSLLLFPGGDSNCVRIWRFRHKPQHLKRNDVQGRSHLLKPPLRVAYQSSLISSFCWDQEAFETAAHAEEGSGTWFTHPRSHTSCLHTGLLGMAQNQQTKKRETQ